jgi:hypothetical protein
MNDKQRLRLRFLAIADQLQACIRDGREFGEGYKQLVKLGRDLRLINKAGR